MTNSDKHELRVLCRQGHSFEYIRDFMDCSDATIRRYMKVFSPKPAEFDPNGFELQDDGTVTSAENTSNTLKTDDATLNVTICQNCYCSTHTIDEKCGKCGVDKSEPVSSDDELTLTRRLDVIQRGIWARINDEINARGVKIIIGDAYCFASVIKEVLHPQVEQLLHSYGDTQYKIGEIDLLEKIDAANTGNGISFWFEEYPKNNGWATMRQYTAWRLAELKKMKGEV